MADAGFNRIEFLPVEITSTAQRYRYKDDFKTEYPRYKELHEVLQKFTELESDSRRSEYGSEPFRRTAAEIMNYFRESKDDPEHQHARKNFTILHDKLSHIKQLVADYDRLHSERSTESLTDPPAGRPPGRKAEEMPSLDNRV